MERATKKATIIVACLFIYMSAMTVWGYRKGTVTETEALFGFGIMCVILIILWFVYRKRERFRDEKRRDQ